MARKKAFEILKQVFLKDGYATLLLKNELYHFSVLDKRFITQIVYGTIRHYRYLSYQYEHLIHAKVNKEDNILLMMSVYQLYFLDKVPAYAIVHEAVSLAHNKGLVNAILLKVSKQSKRVPNDLSIQYSLPEFICKMWQKQYPDVYEHIAQDLLHEAIVYGRINNLKMTKSQLLQDKAVQFVSEYGFIYQKDLVESSYFKNGEVIIQDIASQEVALALDVQKEMRVLDVCAAPGGKTSMIAMLMENTGEIIALDIHEHRLQLLENLMKKCGVKNVKCMLKDASTFQFSTKFDRILVDAPCLGLGVLKGKPDIKLKVTPESMDEIVKIQASILENNIHHLKEGGILVYSTCSLNKKENEKQIDSFLKNHPECTLLSQKTLLPYEQNCDGFYIAVIKKESDYAINL